MRRAKIIATLGPASDDVETIVRMVGVGLDGVRLNFSHGTEAEHRRLVKVVREAESVVGRPLPIMQDLQGTKIRVGALAGGEVVLDEGAALTIDAAGGTGDATRLPVDDALLVEKAQADTQLLLGDGDVLLRITATDGDRLQATVESGGLVRQGAGITAPKVPLPGGLTEKDLQDLSLGAELGVDAVALSFVQSAEEVEEARARLGPLGGTDFLIAKIERVEALDDLDGILAAADGILVARGDLGIALPPEKVPVAQKTMLRAAAHSGDLSITATQMLESMVRNPRPTRAEASDVANAILDGTQCVMLSGETAIGDDPVRVVDMMARIIHETEKAVYTGRLAAPIHRGQSEGHAADALALACAVTAEEIDAHAIVAFTRTGRTAHRVAKHRPRVRIVAATPDARVHRRLNLFWGVSPILVDDAASMEAMLDAVEQTSRDAGMLKSGDLYVLTGGDIGVPGSTNMMRIGNVR